MSLQVVTSEKLVPLLREISDPASLRGQATQVVIAAGWWLRNSPFVNGFTAEEDVLYPPCVRLGVAVRIVEIAETIPERDITTIGFGREVKIAIVAGHIPTEALRPEPIFWEQIIPSYVSLGYFATTA